MRVARCRVEDWHGAVASDAARGSGRCASGGSVMPQGFPGIPSQGLDLVEPVMYLSWTGDVPIVYPLYTCATGNVQDECLALMGVHVGGPDTHLTYMINIALTTEFALESAVRDDGGARWSPVPRR